jgi:uncharacterized protein (DUF1499 family)
MDKSPSLFKRVLRPLLINEVETGKSAWYPELQPRVYDRDPEEVFDAVCAVVDRHPRWAPESDNPAQMRLDVEVRTKVVGFVDDMIVWVQPTDDGRAEVTARSASRIGQGDLGQNARTIRELLEGVDEYLKA